MQTATTKKPETGNSNQTTPAANTSNTTKNTPTSKPPKEKDAKESGGKKSKNYDKFESNILQLLRISSTSFDPIVV